MPSLSPRFVLALGVAALALAPAAFAQNPTSAQASNIDAQDTSNTIAPALPSPDLAPGSSPAAFLNAARGALATGQTGKAQQSLEMAETRLLDRSTPLFQTNDPSRSPVIAEIGDARRALGAGDRARSMQLIDQALAGLKADGHAN